MVTNCYILINGKRVSEMGTTTDTAQGWMVSGPGAKRRILCQDKALMMVEFMFEEQGVGAPHSHPHVQTTFVSAGQFEFTVGGETQILNTGDALIIPSNVEHSCVCLKEGSLLDSFAPRRDDFMEAHGLPLD
ncbi:MAG: quercetin dioxygenase-like cupin family protein [Sulfitobacter sp.]|jgi:quercetin dioxygenase-like cupin family protein